MVWNWVLRRKATKGAAVPPLTLTVGDWEKSGNLSLGRSTPELIPIVSSLGAFYLRITIPRVHQTR